VLRYSLDTVCMLTGSECITAFCWNCSMEAAVLHLCLESDVLQCFLTVTVFQFSLESAVLRCSLESVVLQCALAVNVLTMFTGICVQCSVEIFVLRVDWKSMDFNAGWSLLCYSVNWKLTTPD
jgi:hypothetical protein